MEYLNRVLRIHVRYIDGTIPSMPNYIRARYRLQEVTLDGIRAIFVFPKNELESINSIKKQLERIESIVKVPLVLVLDHLEYRQREYLLRDHIPFIVEGKQIYLPFMAVYMQERFDSEKKINSQLLPSAQLLLLYFIYNGCHNLLTSDATKNLSLTPTSISRASRQLEELGLLRTEKKGIQKIMTSDKDPKELFESASFYLLNPIKKTIFVEKKDINNSLLLSSYSALSEYSMLNTDTLLYLASDSISKWEKTAGIKLYNSDTQCALELWRYDPKKLSDNNCIDRLSLALAMREDKDERIEEAVEEMLNNLWREIDGKRN